MPNGHKIDWLYWDSNDSAMVVAMTPEKRLVMIRQYRYLPNEVALEFPSGRSNKNETLENCAARELEEETGYRCDGYIKLGAFFETMAQLNRKIHIYFGENATKMKNRIRTQDNSEEEFEDIEIVLKDLDELVGLVMKNKISSMGSSLAVLLVNEYIKTKI